MCLDYSQSESCDNLIELTKEQVQAALSSLISIHKQNRTVASRKRRRNKSIDQSIENPNKKQKQIYNDIIVSNINQPESIVLATSGLNPQQMVCFILYYMFYLLNNFRNKSKNLFYFLIVGYYY